MEVHLLFAIVQFGLYYPQTREGFIIHCEKGVDYVVDICGLECLNHKRTSPTLCVVGRRVLNEMDVRSVEAIIRDKVNYWPGTEYRVEYYNLMRISVFIPLTGICNINMAKSDHKP